MSNPFTQVYDDLRSPYLQEKKAKKDYDGDGKIESGSKEHAGVVHNAIQKKKGGTPDGKDTRTEGKAYGLYKGDGKVKIGQKKPPRTAKGAMAYDGPNKAASEARDRVIAKTKAKRAKLKKEDWRADLGFEIVEHHQKDADGNVIPHEEEADGTPSSVEEGAPYTVTNADKAGNTPAFQGLMKNKLNKLTGKPLYKAAPHLQLDKASYEPEGEMVEATKGEKLDIKTTGIKNKVEINPEMKTESRDRFLESMKQARKNVGASTCWDGYKAKGTKMKGGKVVPNCEKEETIVEGKKKGLWDNIHARRKAGKPKRKPGDKNYPKTLDVESYTMLDKVEDEALKLFNVK